jgi:lipoyl(octanoyl) transferase
VAETGPSTAPWTFLDTGARPGQWNMALDEGLAARLRGGGAGAVLRLFQWSPPAVSLGLHQDVSELDAVRCAAGGVDIVRRPTGGRAILHDEELTYTVVMPARGSVMDIYHRISLALVRGLRMSGADVEISRLQPDRLGAGGSPSAIPCFTSTAKYEIEWRGRKLVGSAQRQYREEGVVLQHGSILTGPAHRRLAEYLRVDDHMRTAIASRLQGKTVDLREILGREVIMAELAECVRRGFEEAWGIVFRTITSDEQQEWIHAPTAYAGE